MSSPLLSEDVCSHSTSPLADDDLPPTAGSRFPSLRNSLGPILLLTMVGALFLLSVPFSDYAAAGLRFVTWEAARSLPPPPPPPPQRNCSEQPERHAFIFYAMRPSRDVLNFAVELSERTKYGVHIITDGYVPHNFSHPLVHMQTNITVEDCRAANFTYSGTFFLPIRPGREIWALDRALVLVSRFVDEGTYCRFWLVEDDAFIPSVAAAVHIDQIAGDADYVSTAPLKYLAHPAWPHWHNLNMSRGGPLIPIEHWRHGMVNAVAMSSAFFLRLREYASLNGQLAYSEAIFSTFAYWWGLAVLELEDLQMLWRVQPGRRVTWPVQDVMALPRRNLSWFHPMKDEAMRREYRRALHMDYP